MPGWLPTAIVVNILSPDFADHRRGRSVAEGDHVLVRDGEGQTAKVLLPEGFDAKPWQPKALPPLEVIDGQHRLWAFDDPENFSGFELPVVAFCGLDVTWQAYLFYTINIRRSKSTPAWRMTFIHFSEHRIGWSVTKVRVCTEKLVPKKS